MQLTEPIIFTHFLKNKKFQLDMVWSSCGLPEKANPKKRRLHLHPELKMLR